MCKRLTSGAFQWKPKGRKQEEFDRQGWRQEGNSGRDDSVTKSSEVWRDVACSRGSGGQEAWEEEVSLKGQRGTKECRGSHGNEGITRLTMHNNLSVKCWFQEAGQACMLPLMLTIRDQNQGTSSQDGGLSRVSHSTRKAMSPGNQGFHSLRCFCPGMKSTSRPSEQSTTACPSS